MSHGPRNYLTHEYHYTEPRSGRNGVTLASVGYRQVDTDFGKPEFGTCQSGAKAQHCNGCGAKTARLSDREPWHHVSVG